MKAEFRKNKNGTFYYSFVFYDNKTKKRTRIPQKRIIERFGKKIIDKAEAENALKLLSAEVESFKLRRSKQVEWEQEFYDIKKLVDVYAEWQKREAPNSWKSNVWYLKAYVVPYFLTIKKCNNISAWFEFFEEYKIWLEDEAVLTSVEGKKLSYASKNHAIKTLNTFMRHLKRKNIIDKFFLCESFPEDKLNEKGIDDVIQDNEMETVYSELLRMGHKLEAIYFRFLFFTGFRFNEGLGVSIADIFQGKIEDKVMQRQLEKEDMNDYHGYVVINSQPTHATRGLRNAAKHIDRKPLKGRKKIDERSARTVVILDKTLWNDLVRLHSQELKKLEKKIYGKDEKDYVLFEGIDKTSSSERLKKAFANCKLKYRSWHCCRHSRATDLIGRTGSQFLTRIWLGHSSQRITDKYIHIYEAITRAAKTKKIIAKKGLDFV